MWRYFSELRLIGWVEAVLYSPFWLSSFMRHLELRILAWWKSRSPHWHFPPLLSLALGRILDLLIRAEVGCMRLLLRLNFFCFISLMKAWISPANYGWVMSALKCCLSHHHLLPTFLQGSARTTTASVGSWSSSACTYDRWAPSGWSFRSGHRRCPANPRSLQMASHLLRCSLDSYQRSIWRTSVYRIWHRLPPQCQWVWWSGRNMFKTVHWSDQMYRSCPSICSCCS